MLKCNISDKKSDEVFYWSIVSFTTNILSTVDVHASQIIWDMFVKSDLIITKTDIEY